MRDFRVVTFEKTEGERKPVSVSQKFHSASTISEFATSVLFFQAFHVFRG